MSKLNKKVLNETISKLSNSSVLVIGDIILDEFIMGSPERISREAPVIILEHMSSEFAMGGGSNAAHNISAIGSKCYLAGVVGEDIYSQALETECLKTKIKPILEFDRTRPTTVKTRILSSAHKHPTSSVFFKQQVLRLDRLSRETISKKIEDALLYKFESFLNKVNVVLISDYDLGVCSKRLVSEVIKLASRKKTPVIVDASRDFSRFKGAFLITPNQPDAEGSVGFQIKNKETLIKAGTKLLSLSKSENVLITRGSEGMALFNKKNPENPFILKAFNVSEVFDVTGAGDTVAGTIASALGARSSLENACILGNLAASIVVRKYGTAVTNIPELKKSFKGAHYMKFLCTKVKPAWLTSEENVEKVKSLGLTIIDSFIGLEIEGKEVSTSEFDKVDEVINNLFGNHKKAFPIKLLDIEVSIVASQSQ